MKPVKAILIALGVLAVSGGALWQFWLKGQVAYAKVATAYGAKMVCSCLYVAERQMESCKDDFTADVSAVTFTAIETPVTTANQASMMRQSARASVLGGLVANTAVIEPGLGCTLEKPR